LAQKVLERVAAVGLPADLIPDTITSVTVAAGSDAENALRSAVLEFMDTVREAEHAIAAGRRGEDVPEELDVATLGEISEEEWRAYWPTATVDSEPAPDRIPEPTPADVPERGPVEVPEPAPVEVPETEPAPEDISTEEALADESDEDVGDSEHAAEKFSA
jgi:XTP/dITP diphosphohydrolase